MASPAQSPSPARRLVGVSRELYGLSADLNEKGLRDAGARANAAANLIRDVAANEAGVRLVAPEDGREVVGQQTDLDRKLDEEERAFWRRVYLGRIEGLPATSDADAASRAATSAAEADKALAYLRGRTRRPEWTPPVERIR